MSKKTKTIGKLKTKTMKKILLIIMALLTLSNTYSQKIELIYTSGDFTFEDALKMVDAGYSGRYAWETYQSYEGYIIYSDGTVNGHSLGAINDVLTLFENCKNYISTPKYNITKSSFGSAKIVFTGSSKEYYVTPYLRKDVIKTIKKYLKKKEG